MQQHSVPQNITGFEFKLVGFLTLKQFGYVASAGILSFIYFVSISGILKWILIIPTALLGLALAFVPINGISFDKWVFLLIKAVTAPSIRIWRKEAKEIAFLAPQFSYYLHRPVQGKPTGPTDRTRLKAYLEQLRKQKTDHLDILGKGRFSPVSARINQPSLVSGHSVKEQRLRQELEKDLEKQEFETLAPAEIEKKLTNMGVTLKEGP